MLCKVIIGCVRYSRIRTGTVLSNHAVQTALYEGGHSIVKRSSQAGVAEGQTQWTQNPLSARAYGFNSHRRQNSYQFNRQGTDRAPATRTANCRATKTEASNADQAVLPAVSPPPFPRPSPDSLGENPQEFPVPVLLPKASAPSTTAPRGPLSVRRSSLNRRCAAAAAKRPSPT